VPKFLPEPSRARSRGPKFSLSRTARPPCCYLRCYQHAKSTLAVIIQLFFELLAVRRMVKKVT